VQRETGAIGQIIPIDARIAKAAISYVAYTQQMFLAHAAGGVLSLPAMDPGMACGGRPRDRPGRVRSHDPRVAKASSPRCGLWYLGTLVPVIRLVQVGDQSHADRYTYIPMVGLIMMLAWGTADVARKWPRTRSVITAAGTVSCIVCMALTFAQVAHWQNADTLYQYTSDVTSDNWLAQANLGAYLTNQPERRADAIDHLEALIGVCLHWRFVRGDSGETRQ
jgi:hypothetical protein